MKFMHILKANLGFTSSNVDLVEITASSNTNGQGGGAIMEGSYSVYRCNGPTVNNVQCPGD